MTQLQTLISTTTPFLAPIYRTTCTILGVTMLSAGLAAFFRPEAFASSFGLPLEVSPPSQQPQRQRRVTHQPTREWLIVFAGREIALGTIVLLLLYLNELRALSVVVLAMSCVAAGDSFAAMKYGTKGSVERHLVPGALLVLCLGPLGEVLYPRT